MYIATGDGTGPDRDIVSQFDIADDRGRRIDVDARA
jgi:hypothetical protein